MSTLEMVSVQDQFAGSTAVVGNALAKPCSALAHVGLPVTAHDKDAVNAVLLVERKVTGLLLLRATERAQALGHALKAHCDVSLCATLKSEVSGHYCIRWMSPDCWLLSCPLDEAFAIECALREAVAGHVAIVNVSGGYSILELSGAHCADVLMKSTGYDIHPDHFPPGKVVNTTFAKAQVTLRCKNVTEGEECYELIIRRSFSDYVWLWLQGASAEFGLGASSEIT